MGYLGLGDNPIYPVTATAIEPSSVCFLEIDFFESTLKVNNGLTYSLMRRMANDLHDSQKSMRDLAHMSVKARIAQAFIALRNRFGIRENGLVDLEITRQDIASYAGASYETLFKVVNEFSSRGLVELIGKNILIRDEQALLDIIKQDNRA